MALESELIFLCRRGGVVWTDALELELWELAAALGLHRVETIAEKDTRELTEAKQEYWEETGAERMERIARVAAARKERGRKAQGASAGTN